jgi:hypothetical protein
MSLKKEVEKLTKDLRGILLPSTDEMSRLSYEKYKDDFGEPSVSHIKVHFSEILSELINIEKNMFNNFDLDIQSNWYQFAGKRTTGGIRRAGNPRSKIYDREVPKYTQIGNAVPVILAKAVGEHFRKTLTEK